LVEIVEKKKKSGFLSKFLKAQETSVFITFLLICLIMSIISPYFFKTQNLFNILRSMVSTGIIAIGQTMVIIAAGIDLSVGSVMAVSPMLTARLMFLGYNPLLAVLAGVGIGLGAGLINGSIIAKIKIPPLITTLGMMSIARGMTYLFATGLKGAVASNIPMKNAVINFMGSGYFGPVPFSVIILAFLIILFSLFLRHTVLGRQIYAVGSNEEAAKLSGVNIDKVRLFVFTITGLLCALAGLIQTGMLYTASTNTGMGKELDVIASVVIGGASLTGGIGTVYGAMIGVAIMAVLRNAFVLLHFSIHVQSLAIGIVIILAVGTDRLRHMRRAIRV
jgi:ribose transport system permease protein